MITQQELKEEINYNPETGDFHWIKQKAGRSLGGKAGCNRKHSSCDTLFYRIIRINSKTYPAHVLAWVYIHGNLPLNEIDHIDGNGLNNSIINLRDVTHGENLKNKKTYKNNKTGLHGVRWRTNRSVWTAQIAINKKMVYLYYGKDLFEACCARKSIENNLDYHENHGR